MLAPTKTRPSDVSTAAPTLNFEYGAYALIATSLAAFKSASGGVASGITEADRLGFAKSDDGALGFDEPERLGSFISELPFGNLQSSVISLENCSPNSKLEATGRGCVPPSKVTNRARMPSR